MLQFVNIFSIINTLLPYTRIPLIDHIIGPHHIVYFLFNEELSDFAFVIFTSVDVEIDSDDPAIAHYVLQFRLCYPSRTPITITYYYPVITVHPNELKQLASSNLSIDQILQRIFPHSGR